MSFGTSPLIKSLAGKKVLYVASTGGHLAQLKRISEHAGSSGDSTWVTFKSEQSTSLLSGLKTQYVEYIPPRGLKLAIHAARKINKIIRTEKPDVVISTGAAIAMSALPQAALLGMRSIYVESVSRFSGPSMTGRLLQGTPGVQRYTQHSTWAGKNWKYEFSVLDEFVVVSKPDLRPSRLKVFVTLGTIRPFRFDALVEALAPLASHVDFTWQLGETRRSDLPGAGVDYMSSEEFTDEINRNDVVVSHAGVGTALQLLDMGVRPILVPRRSARGEHVDDHQGQIADHLATADLCAKHEVDELSLDALTRAAAMAVTKRKSTTPEGR